MKILFLTRNIEEYKSANYFMDVINELRKKNELYLYGPGYSHFNCNDELEDIISKSWKPDLIICGHSWLYDGFDQAIDPSPKLNLKRTNIPKIGILNKEYVNLNEKLAFFKRQQFDFGLTHHHEIEKYTNETGTKFYFWPFAADHDLFSHKEAEIKKIDLSFSGILQNINKNAGQSDLRVKIQNEVFYCFRDLPLKKKEKYKHLNIFWNITPRSPFESKIATFLGKRKFLDLKEYSKLQRDTKIYINTKSPIDLISPRYFENMLARALVFCEKSSVYDLVFPENTYIAFEDDLSDFYEKLIFYIENEKLREEITDRAYDFVLKNHTWKKRIETIFDLLNERNKECELNG